MTLSYTITSFLYFFFRPSFPVLQCEWASSFHPKVMWDVMLRVALSLVVSLAQYNRPLSPPRSSIHLAIFSSLDIPTIHSLCAQRKTLGPDGFLFLHCGSEPNPYMTSPPLPRPSHGLDSDARTEKRVQRHLGNTTSLRPTWPSFQSVSTAGQHNYLLPLGGQQAKPPLLSYSCGVIETLHLPKSLYDHRHTKPE